jgi:hypothetical protein
MSLSSRFILRWSCQCLVIRLICQCQSFAVFNVYVNFQVPAKDLHDHCLRHPELSLLIHSKMKKHDYASLLETHYVGNCDFVSSASTLQLANNFQPQFEASVHYLW